MSAVQQEKRPRGRPFGSVGTKASKLRKVAARLKQLAETTAMELVQDSLDGKPVDKEQLSTAKWTITSAKEFHKVVQAEEEGKKSEIDDARAEASIVEEEETEKAVVFQLHMPKKE